MLQATALPAAQRWRRVVPTAQGPGGGFTAQRGDLCRQTLGNPDHLRQLLALDGLAELVKVVLGFRQIGLHQRAAGVEELAVKARAEGRVLRQRRHQRGQLTQLVVQRL
ncbi:Uncharacterised protein [Klebsiella pneumoniae]|nr:Uncharacterised protein [Klebsiella pneumoniae]